MQKIFFMVLTCLVNFIWGEEFFTSPVFQRAHIGIYIGDLETGREIYRRNEELFFPEGSLQKIPLSMVAIKELGLDFQFVTDISYTGMVDSQGVLDGDLLIQGGGDPVLPLTIFDEWAKEVKRAGINKILGNVCVDVSKFETATASPFWLFEDLGNYYGAGASALSINENLYTLTFQPGTKEGELANLIHMNPEIPGVRWKNEVITTGCPTENSIFVFGSEYSPYQFFRGSVSIETPQLTIKAAIPNPAEFCAQSLASRLGISQEIKILNETADIPKTLIGRHYSPPLRELLKGLNTFSNNLYAESLLKILGEGRAEQGIKKIESFLQERGIWAHIKDGAGLAPNNLITPKDFFALLSEMWRDPLFYPLIESLARPGEQGTLFRFPKIQRGVLLAKTGHVKYVYNLAGFLKLDSGKRLGVVIFCNNYTGPLKELRQEMHRLLNYTELGSIQRP